MDEYYRILESLPPALRTPLAKLDAHYAPHIQEIRLRLGQPVQFTICGRLCPAAKFLPGTGLPAALETDTLRDCFLQLCRRSVYAYEDELKQGYFTVQGGCRIGVAGCRGPGGFCWPARRAAARPPCCALLCKSSARGTHLSASLMSAAS